jgi:hypothetical protein
MWHGEPVDEWGDPICCDDGTCDMCEYERQYEEHMRRYCAKMTAGKHHWHTDDGDAENGPSPYGPITYCLYCHEGYNEDER